MIQLINSGSAMNFNFKTVKSKHIRPYSEDIEDL